MKGLTISSIAAIFKEESSSDSQVFHYEADSRKVLPNTCFFALKGEKVDGHDYLKEAREKGAILAFVEKSYQGPDFGLELIGVENVLLAMQTLAKKLLEKDRPFIVAITGSLGKTTTKEFTYTLLSEKFRVHKSPRNYNSQVGLPLALLSREGKEDILLLEMAMSETGNISQLVDIAPPDVALITCVDYVHACHFEDGLMGIAKAKAEIFSHPHTKVKLVPLDLLKFGIFSNVKTFSETDEHADYFFHEMQENYPLPFMEKHFVFDFMAAATIAKELGMTEEEICQRAPHLKTPKMRFEKQEIDGITYINDAYNASYSSTKCALQSMPKTKGKKIAVLGQMVEMGAFSEEMHRKVGIAAREHADYLLCSGDACKSMLDAFRESGKPGEMCENLKDLSKRLREISEKGDVVLIKASRTYEFERIFSYLS